MHKIISASPSEPLKRFIRAFAQREINYAAVDIVQPVLASLEPIIEFDFHDSPNVEYGNGTSERSSRICAVGPHTFRRCSIRLSGSVDSFGIFFQPLGLWQLFRIPADLLVDAAYAGEDLFGKEIRLLWEQMADCRSFYERVRTVEEYLLGRAVNALTRTSIMSAAVHLFQHEGGARISHLAGSAALSIRQFERRFLSEIGMCPKLFGRIARFQRSLDAKVTSPKRPWLEIAHEFGYHDQMHMIKDWKDLNGSSPSRTLMQLGDMRPESLAACAP